MPTAFKAKAKTSQGNAALLPRSNPRSCGNAPDARSAYAIAYDASCEIANFQVLKRNTKVALRGMLHVACLLIMF